MKIEALLHALGARKTLEHRYLFSDEVWVAAALHGLGIEVCSVDGALEIAEVDGIEHALCSALAPQALLFDMDGVVTKTAVVHAAAWKEMFDEFLRGWSSKTGAAFVPFDRGLHTLSAVGARTLVDVKRRLLSPHSLAVLARRELERR